jgi:cytochrome P450
LQAEIDAVMGSEDEVSVEHLGQLRYLEACVKESLRLFPPVPIYVRKLGQDMDLAGTTVFTRYRLLI